MIEILVCINKNGAEITSKFVVKLSARVSVFTCYDLLFLIRLPRQQEQQATVAFIHTGLRVFVGE